MRNPVCRSRNGSLRLIAAALVAVAAGLLFTACLKLPETAGEPKDPSAVDEDSLRTLTSIEGLGVCTEEGWSGSVVNDSETDLEVVVAVEFSGLGSEVVGEGSQTIQIDALSRTEFEVQPETPTSEIAISCSIELKSLVPITE